jgi:DNA polymerase III, epsilon subunit and related 3'-5' exonucleases
MLFKTLVLERPLAFIDVETTGLKPGSDRIVEISVLKIHSDGKSEYKSHRINPSIPIPVQATAIHSITDADVACLPRFEQYAKGILDFLEDCDIAGFNVIKFDLPFLETEFSRCGLKFSRFNRKLVDCQVLYHMLEPRTLKSAYLKYCGREMETNHTAEGDATAAAEILESQLELHAELPRSVSGLHELCCTTPKEFVDTDGKFVWSEGDIVCNFGKKHYGRKLRDIASDAPDYLQWIASSDFGPEVKELVYKALRGEFPLQKTE